MNEISSNVAQDIFLTSADKESNTAAVSVAFIEIYNEESGNGIIAAIIDLSPSYWYFTAKGTVAELKANADDIRNFIENIKIQ